MIIATKFLFKGHCTIDFFPPLLWTSQTENWTETWQSTGLGSVTSSPQKHQYLSWGTALWCPASLDQQQPRPMGTLSQVTSPICSDSMTALLLLLRLTLVIYYNCSKRANTPAYFQSNTFGCRLYTNVNLSTYLYFYEALIDKQSAYLGIMRWSQYGMSTTHGVITLH